MKTQRAISVAYCQCGCQTYKVMVDDKTLVSTPFMSFAKGVAETLAFAMALERQESVDALVEHFGFKKTEAEFIYSYVNCEEVPQPNFKGPRTKQ